MAVSKDCVFTTKEELCVCNKCGFSIKGDCGNIHKNCDIGIKEYPSIFQMGLNAVNAVVEFVKDGGKLSNDEEVKRRIEICNGCEMFVKAENRCKECGCYLALKSAVNSGKCPLDKW